MLTPYGLIRAGERIERGREICLTGEALGNLLLWGPRPGEALTIVDAMGSGFRARVTGLGEETASLQVFEALGPVFLTPEVLLLMALPDKERMETIIEKTTELGISAILPFKSERSISLEEREKRQRKAHRWPHIALCAAKQSRRPTLPRILRYRGFREALEAADKAGRDAMRIILEHEDKASKPLREVLGVEGSKKREKAVILCGPEGGFTGSETEMARKKGFIPVSLGPRVLRTETAAMLATGLVMYELQRE